jgi:hypothetical protein
VLENAGIEPTTVETLALTAKRSYPRSARSHHETNADPKHCRKGCQEEGGGGGEKCSAEAESGASGISTGGGFPAPGAPGRVADPHSFDHLDPDPAF